MAKKARKGSKSYRNPKSKRGLYGNGKNCKGGGQSKARGA